MRTTKKIYSKTLLSIALIGLSGLAFANDTDIQSMDNSTKSFQSESMKMLLKRAWRARLR